MKNNLQLPTTAFKKIMIGVLARDEVNGLRETVEALAELLPADDVEKIVMYLAPHATHECIEMAKSLEKTVTRIETEMLLQKTWEPVQEYVEYYKNKTLSSHLLMISADLEIPPKAVMQMLETAKENPNALVSLTRWKKGGSFEGYPVWQLPLQWIFQQVVRVMYGANFATDATAGYGAFPLKIGFGLNLREKRQAVFLEYKLCMLRLKMPLIEIPVEYHARREGKSTSGFWHKVRYLVPLIRVRFTPRRKLFRFEDYSLPTDTTN
ncbi:MAG: hypothetical protein FWG82_04780 [Oscillospiraceae bacterium]|nr:hypothetical protein [Oscillospiraceae bacterium]